MVVFSISVLSALSKILILNIEIILSNQKILHSQLYFSNYFFFQLLPSYVSLV